jgi:hypothetical protein
MDYVKKFDSSIEKALTRYIRKPEIIYGMIILFIALYAAHIAPAVPEVISKIFSNTYFKLMFMIFILWIAQISPSMSIVIAVGFLMITNYANNKALFEMLDNTSAPETAAPAAAPTPLDSVDAVNQLTLQAMSPEAGSPEKVQDAAMVAVSTMAPSDVAGQQAVIDLAQQALTPAAGEPTQVATDMTTAVAAINNNLPATTTAPAVVQAVQVLADSAASPSANNVSMIQTATNIATSAVPSTSTTPEVISTINALATNAVTPAPVSPEVVTAAAQKVMDAIMGVESTTSFAPAVTSMPAEMAAPPAMAPPSAECYPMRSVDMSKVTPDFEGHSIEDYQPFVASA